MSTDLLVRGARQLLTLSGCSRPRRGAEMRHLNIIQDGAILIRDGIIQQIGPTRRVEHLKEAQHAEEIDASGKVVMPGFIDPLIHPLCGPARLAEYDNRATTPLDHTLAPSLPAVRSYSAQRLELEGRKVIRQSVRHGTTTMLARTGFGLDESTELKSLRVLHTLEERPLSVMPVFSAAQAVAPEFAGREQAYLDFLLTLLPVIQRRRLARWVDVACGGDDGFTVPAARHYIRTAREMGFGCIVSARPGASGYAVKMAIEESAASIDLECDFDEDIAAALAVTDAVATLLPGRSFHSGRPFTPARRWIDSGAAVALATGYDSFRSPTCSMPAVMSIACAQMGMTPAESVVAATINAAWAACIAHRTGSLEVGKEADFLVLRTGDFRDIPFHFGMNPVAMSFRCGRQVYPAIEVVQ